MLAAELVDFDRLAAWMDDAGLERGAIAGATLLQGGTQNILVRFERGQREFVLRRPALSARPGSHRIIGREARLLGAIAGTDVPHPALVKACHDTAVLGAAFYLMEPVEGFNPTVAMPGAAATDPRCRYRMGIALVDGLAALARLDSDAIGLGDFGKPEAYLARQVHRWTSELEGYSHIPEWTGRSALGNVDVLASWLDLHVPQRSWTGVVHGDYHIGNGLFGPHGELAAIVDWEMATLGDPLLDFARLLLSWPDPERVNAYTMRVTPIDGFPSREDMIARFALRTGCSMDELSWFEAMARYKLGVILEGSHARAQAGLADPVTGNRLHASACALIDDARRIAANA